MTTRPLAPDHWVLITEGGGGQSRAAVAAVRTLAMAGYRPAVTVSHGGPSMAALSRYCARRIHVPSAEADPRGFAEAIHVEQRQRSYLATLPASEPALLALGTVPHHFQDKARCAEVAAPLGMSVPSTRVFATMDELHAAAGDLEYPIIVKPNLSKRFPTLSVHSAARLARLGCLEGPLVVQPYLSEGLHGVVGLMWRGELVAAMHMRYLRLWPRPCGTVAAAESIPVEPELEWRLGALLAEYDGIFHVDLAGPYVLDVNLRIHATLPLAIATGADVVRLYCDLLRGVEVRPVRGRPGVLFRWFEGDVRSILWSLRRHQLSGRGALAALWPRAPTVLGYESLRDPGPLLARVAYAARQVPGRWASAQKRGRKAHGMHLES